MNSWVPASVESHHVRDYYVIFFGSIVGLVNHLVFLLVFAWTGVYVLAAFNVLSVAAFASNLVYLRRTGKTLGPMGVAATEVTIHQLLAVYVLGWSFGFQYYLLVVPAFILLADFKGWGPPLAISALSMGSLVFLLFWGQYLGAPHPDVGEGIARFFYALNLLSAAVLVAVFSLLFRLGADDNEQTLRAVTVEAQAANEAKSQFLATMSHEFRTPMNAIIGFAGLALRRGGVDPRTRGDLRRIEGASNALLALINDILDFSKIEAGKLDIASERFDLHDLLKGLSEMFGTATVERNTELVLALEPGVPRHLVGDALRLRQVLANLVGNAIKFTEGGEIVVRVSMLEDGEEDVRLMFSVEDTGIGIEPDRLPTLFKPFTQADGSVQRKFGGTGLGLSISRQLVGLMDGTLDAESEVGKGSRFYFDLTLPKKEGGARTHSWRPLRVLVADDSDASRAAVAEMLSAFGYTSVVVASGNAAVEKARAEVFDVVLLDRMMADGDGFEAARQLRNLPHDDPPRMLLMTSHGRDDVSEDAVAAGFDDVIFKPMTPSSLLDGILSVVDPESVVEISDRESSRVTQRQLSGVRLLVVDDVELNREIAREMLESVGAEVSLANSGEQALEALAQSTFDAVLMDVQMPGMDGYTATARIKEMDGLAKLPIIAMTAHALVGDRQRSLDAGMVDHVTKPIDFVTLVLTVATWAKPRADKRARKAARKAREDNVVLPDTIDGIDLEDALHRVRGKKSLLIRLLKGVREDYADSGRQIAALLAAGDRAGAQALAHKVKGLVGNVGAVELYEAATALDAALKGDDDAMEALAAYDAALARLMSGLEVLAS